MLRPLVLTCLFAAAAFAQTLTRAPTLLERVTPAFPADAGADSKVVLEIDIAADGTVSEAKVVTSGGAAFDDAALSAARKLVFTPAEVDGQPAPVRIQYTSAFVYRPPVVEDAGAPDAGARVVTLSGQLKAAGTREPVAAAIVTVDGLEALSDEQGRFAFEDIAPGTHTVRVSSAGFEVESSDEVVTAGNRTEVTYYLRRARAFETVVRDTAERREASQVRLVTAELRMIPGTNNDAFRVVQNLPGVARSPFGSGALVVRGSKAWDSRIYVDEVQIPQLFHFAGLTATFNSATVERISFQPGNFSADFGRSIGGLVQAEVKTPSKSGVHGFVDVNVFDTSAMVEAPLSADWSVSASGRFGLAQFSVPWALKTFAPQVQVGFALAPQYWDYQVRAERRSANSKNRLFIAAFGSSDAWAFVQPNPFLDADVEGNQSASGSSQLYNRLVFGVDQRLNDNLSLVSRVAVGFDINQQNGAVSEIFFRTQQVPIQVRERLKFDVPKWNTSFAFGLDALVTPTTFNAQQPPLFKANQLPDPYLTRRLDAKTENVVYVEPALFADATWTPTKALSIRGGVRVDSELGVMRKAWVNPRLNVRYALLPELTLKAGAGLFQQPPDYRSGVLSTAFGNPGLLPEGAGHFTVGAEAQLFKLIEVDVSGYYKLLFNQARQTLASGEGSDISIPGAETRYSSGGYGRSYGVEALVRIRPTKYFVGWVAYSLSRFERDYYGGIAFAPGPLDQPHNLIVVGSVTLPLEFNLGARFRFASGPLVTPFVSSIFDVNANTYVPLPGLPWSQRLPDFAQLDVRVDKRFTFKTWSLTAYLDVQNVTNAKNPEALLYNFNYSRSTFVTGIPILPTAGLRGEW